MTSAAQLTASAPPTASVSRRRPRRPGRRRRPRRAPRAKPSARQLRTGTPKPAATAAKSGWTRSTACVRAVGARLVLAQDPVAAVVDDHERGGQRVLAGAWPAPPARRAMPPSPATASVRSRGQRGLGAERRGPGVAERAGPERVEEAAAALLREVGGRPVGRGSSCPSRSRRPGRRRVARSASRPRSVLAVLRREPAGDALAHGGRAGGAAAAPSSPAAARERRRPAPERLEQRGERRARVADEAERRVGRADPLRRRVEVDQPPAEGEAVLRRWSPRPARCRRRARRRPRSSSAWNAASSQPEPALSGWSAGNAPLPM